MFVTFSLIVLFNLGDAVHVHTIQHNMLMSENFNKYGHISPYRLLTHVTLVCIYDTQLHHACLHYTVARDHATTVGGLPEANPFHILGNLHTTVRPHVDRNPDREHTP